MTVKKLKEFIAWDGEGTAVEPIPLTIADPVDMTKNFGHVWEDRPLGKRIDKNYVAEPQPYVLLRNSKCEPITREEGLSTNECFEYILETKQQYKHSIFVGFGFNYDINQMLKDVDEQLLWALHDRGRSVYGNYRFAWRPGKSFSLKHGKTGRRAIIYDVFGFFQSAFLEACRKYLGNDDPGLQLIEQGKAQREAFKWEQLDEFIIPYNKTELDMLVRMMDIVREEFGLTSIYPAEWHGPGAVAAKTLDFNQIKIPKTTPNEVLDASQFAYAGGRFEQFKLGRYEYPVYEYDIHSAYPAAAFQLPDLSDGTWEYVERFEPESFGIWHVYYDESDRYYNAYRPQPLFCRSENGSISYPSKVWGWYWSPEARFVSDSVREGWVFRPNTDFRPFSFVKELYDKRRVLQLTKNSLERAIKLILNSLYGKLAQTIGALESAPRWHCLEAAGYITSYTRGKIYEAILLDPRAIIAAETDAVFSTSPLNLPLSNELGDWEEITFKEITYLQSGFYYAIDSHDELVVRYRGMDRDRATRQPIGLPYRTVLDQLREFKGQDEWMPASLCSYTTRFVGLGLGLRTDSVWRSWETRPHIINLDGRRSGKRQHIKSECPECQTGKSLYDCLHPLQIGGYSGESAFRPLPWREPEGLAAKSIEWSEWLEMDTTMRDFSNDVAKYQ